MAALDSDKTTATGYIRNFCIIAHIDHGKSTLAGRLIESTGSLASREMADQVLDSMDLERERGITIKAQTASMSYMSRGKHRYQFNLIDTPGHADFSYEVSRSLAACEGACVVVDASQGVEAQTLAHAHTAHQLGLTLIPVVNKIDLPHADPEKVVAEMEDELMLPREEAIFTSAKTGDGITELLEALAERIPPPSDESGQAFRGLIFDSWFDPYLGAVCLVRVKSGAMKRGERMQMMSTGKSFDVVKICRLTPKPVEVSELRCGEVGFLAGSVKHVGDLRVGDTVTSHLRPAVQSLEGFRPIKPMVFGGVFPLDASDYSLLSDSLEKLRLNDAALSVEPENSGALGMGYRVGFLGLLHMDIVQERLEREYRLELIFTAPSVIYHVYLTDGTMSFLENPSKLPDPATIERIEEPYVELNVYTPQRYIGALIQLLQERRGVQKDLDYGLGSSSRVKLVYSLPMNEMIFDLHDKLKSLTSGYASMDYEISGYEAGSLVKLEILVNGETVDALASITHRSVAQKRGRALCKKLKGHLSRHMFQIAIQAAIGNKVVARETLSAFRKDVTAKCYGGDITRKRKLLEKQKAGKKKMKAIGNVQIPKSAFLSILSHDDS